MENSSNKTLPGITTVQELVLRLGDQVNLLTPPPLARQPKVAMIHEALRRTHQIATHLYVVLTIVEEESWETADRYREPKRFLSSRSLPAQEKGRE
jgi:hypothetical protein